MQIDLAARARYLLTRLRTFTPERATKLARQIAAEQDKWMPAVLADMMWWAAFHDTAFVDYYENDFASLNRAERNTFMTSLIQHHIAKRVNDEEAAAVLFDKLNFNRRFGDYLGREWIDLNETDADGLKAFAERHPVLIGKVPMSREGKGVSRYDTTEITDWAAFRGELVAKDQMLVEQPIVQHPYLAAYCAGTVNTTRVTAYFDGEKVHFVSSAQKFGRGEVSDQSISGGFFSMLDDEGRAVGPGHSGKHAEFYEVHPESGLSIPDFQVPLWDRVLTVVDEVARLVPEVPYVGWDIAVGPEGPVVLEGNWIPGLYESRVTATGIRTGTRPRHEAVMTW